MEAVRFSPEQFRATLPRLPYCTDNFAEGLRIRARDLAESKRYIQANPGHLKLWLVFDCDYTSAAVAWYDANLPEPTWIAQNPRNGHAHLAWGLEVPVNTKARMEPLRYAAAIEAAYSDALQADMGYSGLISKNPLNTYWRVSWGRAELYGLEELAEWVDLKAPRRPRAEPSGLGRNCDLFDRLRLWAYKAVRQYWRPDGFNAWAEAVLVRAERLNDYEGPLPYAEVRATARSVAKWTWGRMSPTGFRASQAARGHRKGKGRREAGTALLAAGWTPKAVSEAVGVTERTVYNWRTEMSAKALNTKAPALPTEKAISDKQLLGPSAGRGLKGAGDISHAGDHPVDTEGHEYRRASNG